MKEILNKLHLSIREFAELYEIPYQTVRQWTVGERRMPEYLKKLIEKDIERRTKGKQITIEETSEENTIYYGLKIITPSAEWQRIYSDKETRDKEIEREVKLSSQWNLKRRIEKFKCIVLTN